MDAYTKEAIKSYIHVNKQYECALEIYKEQLGVGSIVCVGPPEHTVVEMYNNAFDIRNKIRERLSDIFHDEMLNGWIEEKIQEFENET